MSRKSVEATTGTWIILGASSSMGRSFAASLAAKGDDIVLAGRDMDDMARTAGDIHISTGRTVDVVKFDATDYQGHQAFAAAMAQKIGIINVVLLFGLMPEQDEMDVDVSKALSCIEATFTGAVSILHHLAPVMETRGGGTIIGVGSVAGDRGRLKNYVYGSAKAGLHTYLAGLRNRLGRSGIHVMTVKPGFVDTSMTWGLPGLFLVASPDQVADSCIKAAAKGRDEIYVPWFWWGIMTIIRNVPEKIFKKLSI